MRTRTTTSSIVWILGLTGLLAVCSGCDTSVEPLVERERYFTLYGSFDMGRDTQFVRVIPIQRSLINEPTGPLDAEVASTDEDTGQRVVWQDSLVTFGDGAVGHVFWAVLDVQAGHTYRLDVRRSDGTMTFVIVQIPPPLQQAPLFGDYRLKQAILWPGIDEPPAEVEVIYYLVTTDSSRQDVWRPYAPEEGEIAVAYFPSTGEVGSVWRVSVDLIDDSAYLSSRVGGLESWWIDHIEMRIVVANSSLSPPMGVFDPEVLSNPGVFSNVNQGFGLVGGIAQYTTTWSLAADVQQDLGFGGSPDPNDDEGSCDPETEECG